MKWEAALPKARQWQEWLDYHRPRLERDNLLAFLVEAYWHLTQSFVVMSRRLRKNPHWDVSSMGERDWESLSADAEERLTWFRRERPRELNSTIVPLRSVLSEDQRALIQFGDAIEGALKMQVRIAHEIEAIQRTGFQVVNVNPFQAPHEFAGAEEES